VRPRAHGHGAHPDGVAIRETGTASASAVGVVRYTFGATTAHLSFIVSNSSGSVTTGKALYYSSNANVVMVINVTCLYKSGSTATFGGIVLESNDPSIEGDDASWQVQDGSTDYASLVNLAEAGLGPSCTTPGEFDLVAVSAGTITL
jgi:hypothetical protein